jgi:hypothetical protein
MPLHHVRLIHGSPPNASSRRRIGFAIRYIPTYVRQLSGEDSATLVRGRDTCGSFEQKARPLQDFEPRFVKMHQAITDRAAQILLSGSQLRSLK